MKKMLSVTAIMSLLFTLAGCSSTPPLSELSISSLNSLINPASQQQPAAENAESAPRNYVVWTSGTISVPVDTAAMRLKQHYGFVSNEDVAAARNSGLGNAGWSASAISEGTSWEALPGSYFRMSRNWAGNDRLTLEITGSNKESVIKATYISSNPGHVKQAWTARLWKQIPDVARGKNIK